MSQRASAFHKHILFLNRMYGKPCATYETASLRQFQLGRTDTIRSCSSESLEFTKGMDDPNLSNEQKADLLRKAVGSHKSYVTEVRKFCRLSFICECFIFNILYAYLI